MSLRIHTPHTPLHETILTPAALEFVEELVKRYAPRIASCLAARAERQARFDAGDLPDFLPETAYVRAGAWKVAELPEDLLDRAWRSRARWSAR